MQETLYWFDLRGGYRTRLRRMWFVKDGSKKGAQDSSERFKSIKTNLFQRTENGEAMLLRTIICCTMKLPDTYHV